MNKSKQDRYDFAYLKLALEWANLSYCKRKKVGALIVKDKMIISDGYNGSPSGFDNNCEDDNGITHWYILHAEANAILKTAKSNRDNVTSQIASRTAADKINVRTADLAELTARNDMKIAEAEIDFKNSTNLYNWKTANADRDYNWRTAEADREMKKDLALLGFKDKDADRRYDREESREERRQLMLLQMLKGLQNLGGSLAI